tara:strand:+ start:721 stop:1617 length:897 start_codon:yes stop_codon:yes gene_type:complete
MADLNSKKPSATFHSLLNLGTADNQTLDTTLRVVEDGRGNDSVLKLSTLAVQLDSLKIDGSTISTESGNTNITLTPHGTGDVYISADTLRLGDSNVNALITTIGTGDLRLDTNSGSNSGYITIEAGTDQNITIEPNGTGLIVMNPVDINGGNIDGSPIGVSAQSTIRCTTLQSDNLFKALQGIECQDQLFFVVTPYAVAGPTDNVDVADISMLKLTTTDNSVVIGGFINGVAGQILYIVKYQGSNVGTLEHAHSHAYQKIYLQSGADETIGVSGIKASNPMGGWVLVCDGSHWYSIGR